MAVFMENPLGPRRTGPREPLATTVPPSDDCASEGVRDDETR